MVIRWAAVIVGLISFVSLAFMARGWGAFALALVGFTAFLVVCWSFGAFRRSAWVQDDRVGVSCERWDEVADRHRAEVVAKSEAWR